ncbi:ribose-phosphate diphosphokinase [Candidatus Protochlamydia phocaeensis]|uniref:ribose-phosphate diphosphokinase n=1 Tax=Candidatus Protochlamydia phocaeensis TaxID=1414722 RepID=UPI00083918F2|nr:ribose-phosphate diphosphokinase [Candidatus Protochlamydia phocaeensis]
MSYYRGPLLFCGSSHTVLGEEISRCLAIPLGRLSLDQFPDGETKVEILEEVRGRDVFVLQSTALNPNFYLMELLILIDALKRASAKNIVAIIPYFGYCRQDRKDKPGVPITAKLVANMLAVAGMSRLITLDLHAGQLEGFFEVPVDHLSCQSLLAAQARQMLGKDGIVVAPDIGSVKVAKKMAKLLGIEMAIIEKQRTTAFDVQMTLIGNVAGKHVLLADDMCSTGGTLVAAAQLCRQQGAKNVIAAVTHGICAGDAIKDIEDSILTSLIMTNTVPMLNRFSHSKKVAVLSIASLIAEAIKGLLDDYIRPGYAMSLI